MSYDLYVVRRDIPENFWDYGYDPDYDYGCYFNYTYNLGPFFAAYHVHPSTDLDGKTGRECAEIIGHALMRIYLQPLHELRSEYNPRDENGQLVDWAVWTAQSNGWNVSKTIARNTRIMLSWNAPDGKRLQYDARQVR